jgi:2-polyprenyl-6-methoxyphenol hydroxylase-like FAD-dependent oxidoreductase
MAVMTPETANGSSRAISARCCVVGGGPAGLMLSYLLARAGIDVVILEKHGDFLRDFRGDTIHPSTLQLMHELGLLTDLLKLPHGEAPTLKGRVGDFELTIGDFSHLPTQAKFIAFMPQWDFLNFLADRGRRYPTFRLLMRAEATDLMTEDGTVCGVRAKTPDGPVAIPASLVVACDGRHSTLRERAGLEVENLGAPMDVLWFRISRAPNDPTETMGTFAAGLVFISINRGDYWQCAYAIPKGTIDELHRRGLSEFRDRIGRVLPFLAGRTAEIADWNQVKLLTVAVDRLKQWYRPGLLCIGDAAHAMSPIGGVGVNLAVQDAVATANLLAEPLRSGAVSPDVLRRVQERRQFPAAVTQRIQIFLQNRVVAPTLGSTEDIEPPLPLKLLKYFPVLRRIPGRLVGLGVRPEHIRTPERAQATSA